MLNLESNFMALKAAWFPNRNNNNDTWSFIWTNYIEKYLTKLFSKMSFCITSEKTMNKKLPNCYQEVVKDLCRSNIMEEPQTKNELYDNMIWGNSLLKVSTINICLINVL